MDYGGEPFGPGRGYLIGGDPTFSPDGREIAFEKEADIWISGVNGRDLRRITQGSEPAWSPNGARIAFTLEKDIWVVSPTGVNRARLTTDPGEDEQPAWSPDGTQIAFISEHGDDQDIWIMNADGSHPRKVTDLPGWRSPNSPAFSPDGRRLVFSAHPDDRRPNPRINLMIINTDGTGLCQLTTEDSRDGAPHWSAGGIVFESYRPGSGQGILIIQPDGTGLQFLHNAIGFDPVWSPDGTRIAFGEDGSIAVFDLVDRTVKPLTQLNVVPLVIYINPGRPNTIDSKTDAMVPVAILSAPWFDPLRQIERASITFGPTGMELGPASCGAEDVNQDRMLDLVCQFDVAASFSPGHTEGILKAKGVDGILYEGRDGVVVTR